MNAKKFVDFLITNNLNFFVGVPDSLLQKFLYEIDNSESTKTHIVATNEGSALAIAAGYYLGTSRMPVVYLQNSGLGNLINPLTSLTHHSVYNIPIMFIIGWRGSEQNDEPQHNFQGKITQELLNTLEIPFFVLDSDLNFSEILEKVTRYSTFDNKSFAILVKKGVFDSLTISSQIEQNELIRSEVIEKFLLNFNNKNTIFTSTTGKTSREMDTLIKKHSLDIPYFLNIGSMGHVSALSLGIDIGVNSESRFKILCFDGDGSALMHLGNLSTIGKNASKNFVHIILNNKVHESVGSQPISNPETNFIKLSKAIGYRSAFAVKTNQELNNIISKIKYIDGPILVQIEISKKSDMHLSRPTKTPPELKLELIQKIKYE